MMDAMNRSVVASARWSGTALAVAVAGAAVATVGALAASPAYAAQDRLARSFGEEDGLIPAVLALAQDSTGFLWAGTRAGLFRFDGERFERWAPEKVSLAVSSLAVSPEGTVVAVDADGRILEMTRSGARVLPGRARRAPLHVDVVAFDADGRLWIVTSTGNLAWRSGDGDGGDGDGDAGGSWHPIPSDAFAGDTVRKVLPGGPGGGVLVTTGDALWRAEAGASPRRILDRRLVLDALALPDGGVAALTAWLDVVRIDPAGRVEELTSGVTMPISRAISLAERDGAFWIATDRLLIGLGPNGSIDVLGPEDVEAGGPILVDHEGSLWHAGTAALTQYPEPRTRVWNRGHGLPSAQTRYLARSREVVWVSTWSGTGFLRPGDGEAWEGRAVTDWSNRNRMCEDEDGTLLVGTNRGRFRLEGDRSTLLDPDSRGFLACAPAEGGGHWVGTGHGLYRLSADGRSASPVSSFPKGPDIGVQAVVEDRAGRIWGASGERVCRAAAADVRAGDPAWTCDDLPPGTVHLYALLEVGRGHIWAASHMTGILRYTEEAGWRPLEQNDDLPTRAILGLVPSPRDGVWLVGHGTLRRVRPHDDGSGWRVLEQLDRWHGLRNVGGHDLLEHPDGTVWIATSFGVVQLPAGVRTAEPVPPRVALVDAFVGDRRASLDEPLVLPADRNHLELYFAALSFRDRGRIRYQVRLSPEHAWIDAERPSFHWLELPAGRHRPEVRASLDGATWSTAPAEFAFRVLPPWYRTGWALGLFALAGAALLYAIYRARLAYLVGLERQRTRIAMDLHDEMGSGLASIGILAGVLSESGDAADPDEAAIARNVATTAEELGAALSDIVWSLDPQRATLDELAARLAEHGGRLFPEGVRFDAEFPRTWPPSPLSLSVLRSVLLIGLEALHNAARHARARRVVLSFQPDGGRWCMAVRDDGGGLAPAGEPDGRERRGRGLRNMRRRAADIDADLELESQPGHGTTVRLRFDPTWSRGRGPWRRWQRA